MEFQPNNFNSIQLTEWTKNCISFCYKGNNLKNKNARVMVLVHETSSECALEMYKVSLKYPLQLSSYRADSIFVTDRGKGNLILPRVGDIISRKEIRRKTAKNVN